LLKGEFIVQIIITFVDGCIHVQIQNIKSLAINTFPGIVCNHCVCNLKHKLHVKVVSTIELMYKKGKNI